MKKRAKTVKGPPEVEIHPFANDDFPNKTLMGIHRKQPNFTILWFFLLILHYPMVAFSIWTKIILPNQNKKIQAKRSVLFTEFNFFTIWKGTSHPSAAPHPAVNPRKHVLQPCWGSESGVILSARWASDQLAITQVITPINLDINAMKSLHL